MQMPLVLTNRRRRGGSGPAPAFSPSTLYSSGSQGIWLDPSDLSTMFSDRAGTTPVTTPGTVVGLRLDKSKGLVLGAELVTNGTFPVNTNGWTAQSATLSVDTERLKVVTVAAGNGATQVLSGLVVGKTYKISLDVTVGGSAWAILLGLAFGQGQGFSSGIVSGSQTYSRIYTHTNAANNVFSLYSADAGTTFWDNISVRELPGNHAVAPTDAARPVYGVEPKGGRRNLLTWSEGFDNAAWTKTGVTPSGGTLSATAGGSFHSATQAQTTSGSNATASVLVKAGTSNFVWMTLSPSFGTGNYATAVANLATGAVTKTQSGGTLTGATAGISGPDALGFYRVTLSAANPSTSMSAIIGISNGATPTITSYGSVEFSAAGTETIITGGAQLELGSTATNYQRVLSAYDVTESGVATTHYVQFDGANSSMSTAAIDFTATDKMSVFAGVRKLSDATGQILYELSASVGNNTNSFAMYAGNNAAAQGAFWTGQNRGNGAAVSSEYNAVAGAPVSTMLTAQFAIQSAPRTVIRANGAVIGTLTGSADTGNFGNYQMFFGRRANASFPFNGKDYGIIIVGKAASAGEITDTETWLAARTSGVTL